MKLPSYSDLPGHDARGLFGPDDTLGSLNRLTPSVVRAAASAIRTGTTFSLNAPVDWPRPGIYGRQAPSHHVIELEPGTTWDDYLDGFYLQGSSQWDSFRHAFDLEVGLYNGLPADRAGIESWAARGIAGRGVLLDVARSRESSGAPLAFDRRDVISVADLELCAERQGVTLRDGDILLVRVGWTTGYEAADASRHLELSKSVDWAAPGLAAGDDMAAFLWDTGIAAVATDGPALEAFPIEGEFLHHKLLGRLGIPIGELWWLDALADACASDGSWEFFFTSAPLNVPGGIGSPANALAIK